MDDHRRLLVFPRPFDVVDIEHPDRLDWRRCTLSVSIHTPTGRATLSVKVRHKAGGRHPHTLFEGAFGAAVESVARDVLSAVPGLDEPNLFGTGILYRGGSRGYAQHKGSATLSYTLPEHVAAPLLALQGHTTLQVMDKARRVAEHQARVRAATPG